MVFGLPSYIPPDNQPDGSVTIRHGLDGAVVVDGEVGEGQIVVRDWITLENGVIRITLVSSGSMCKINMTWLTGRVSQKSI